MDNYNGKRANYGKTIQSGTFVILSPAINAPQLMYLPDLSVIAEKRSGSKTLEGNIRFIIVKIDFLISHA